MLHFIKGDATNPSVEGNKIIVHCCNDAGAWGAGFVLALSNKWPKTKNAYQTLFRKMPKVELGSVQFVSVENDIVVANLIGQKGFGGVSSKDFPFIRYDAIKIGLDLVASKAMMNDATVHMPRIGCGLAGGMWSMIEPIINETLISNKIDTYVYDLP
jgi:O-acetyl-ADP-ribose deacetylase (regulator of RNase III)